MTDAEFGSAAWAQCRLKELAEELCPPPAGDPGEDVRVLAVLGLLAALPAGEVGPEHEDALDALARKVHVARDVRRTYTSRWRRRKGAPRLDPAEQVFLAAVLLHHGECFEGAEEERRGRALKALNAGLAALDRAVDAGAPDALVRGWRTRADALLAELAA